MFVKIFKNMPVICTKNHNARYKALITSRVSSKKREDDDSALTLRNFSIKNLETPSHSTFLVGAAIPNSTVKASLNKHKPDADISSDLTRSNSVVDKDDVDNKGSTIEDKKNKGAQKQVLGKIEEKDDKSLNENNQAEVPPTRTTSIITASEKLQELQELQKLLHKSYEPKPLFEPRRPTLDSIKSAIEKAKQEAERNKNVGTRDFKEEDELPSEVLKADVATSTQNLKKIRKKKKKKESEKGPPSISGNSSPNSSAKSKVKKKKKINIAVKIKADIEKSSQP